MLPDRKCKPMKDAIKNAARLMPPLLALLWLTGCETPQGKAARHYQLNNATTLMARPDFSAAAKAAPEWTRAALTAIADLEYELERK